MRFGIVAGEPSGDLLGAGLVAALRRLDPEATFAGIGGPQMQAAGVRSLYPMDQISIMGFEGLAGGVRRILAIRRALRDRFAYEPPDAFIGIDVPDFNLGLEKALHARGVATVHYVSPTVWAWRGYRIHKIRRAVDRMLVLFPFEADYYRRHGVPVSFIGHPMADELATLIDPGAARAGLGFDPTVPLIALLPGSRASEVTRLGPIFARTAARLAARRPQLTFVAPMVNAELQAQFKRCLDRLDSPLPVTLLVGQSRVALAAADVAVVASGTAALEAALLEKPLVVAYQVSQASAWLARMFMQVDYYSMPNHLLASPGVPEFMQGAANAANLAAAVEDYLDHPARARRLSQQFAAIRASLAGDADARAARAIYDLLAARRGGE